MYSMIYIVVAQHRSAGVDEASKLTGFELSAELFTQDLRTAAREFCALFYQVELSEAQLGGILAGSQ
jgi:hypothetical protein